jgi:hypothetical protein
MGVGVGGAAGEEGAQPDERGQRHLRGVDQLQGGTALARRHPFGDDGAHALRQRAEKDPFASQRDDSVALYSERLPIQPMPRIVDGDRR